MPIDLIKVLHDTSPKVRKTADQVRCLALVLLKDAVEDYLHKVELVKCADYWQAQGVLDSLQGVAAHVDAPVSFETCYEAGRLVGAQLLRTLG